MNLNGNISLSSFKPSKLLPVLNRARGALTTMVVMGLIGYTGYQMSHITNVEPDAAYVAKQEAANKATKLHVNKTTIDELKQLQSGGDTSIPINTGKQDPFDLAN